MFGLVLLRGAKVSNQLDTLARVAPAQTVRHMYM